MRNDKGNKKKKKIEGGKKKQHCNLHVIQIVRKECVIITLFTQPSRSRNVSSVEFFFARNTLTGKDTFYFDRFFEDTGDLENCFSLHFERVFKDRVSPQVQALF